MSVTLDGQKLFDEQELTIERKSIRRKSVERTIGGVDGVLSIDLGERGREITQRGILRAKSKVKMDEKINAISACMDGNTHTLITSSGEEIDDLRMDYFEVTRERAAGSGLCCDYEIVYTQLVA